jgi:V8-like Glu-specific endopeptidase
MRFAPFVPIFAVLIAGMASPALAITNGSADDVTHPEVGAILGHKPNPDGTWTYCTGTLISPTVFLTAAHCGDPGEKTARVTFSSHYKHGDKVYTGRYVPDSRFKEKNELYDMAVVVFSTAVPDIKPATLPTEGMLDRLKADSSLKTSQFTPVGYGAVGPVKGTHGKEFNYNDTRSRTSISFEKLTHSWLQLSVDHSKGDGSTCYGDSGGPNFLGDSTSDLLVATTISGDDDTCKSTNIDYRLDTPSARRFLGKFVTLP